MEIITQNIFKYGSILNQGVGRIPLPVEKLSRISRRSKLGKFIKELENLLNGQSCNISIYDCNRHGYVSLAIGFDDKFKIIQKEIEKICYRSNY